MKLNEELRNFIEQLASKAIEITGEDEAIKKDYVKEYISQIIENDYNCMIEFARTTSILIPSILL